MVELTPEQMVKASQAFKEYILPMMPLGERLVDVSPGDVSEEELNKIPFIHHIKEQGIEQARIEALNQIVTIRFSVELGKFEKQLDRLTLKALKELTEIALTVESLADFKKALTEMHLKNQ